MKLTNIDDQLNRIEKILSEQIDRPMSFNEACRYLNYSKSYLYKCTCKRLIPFYKPGGKKIFFSKKELDEWIYKYRVKTNTELDEIANNGM